LRDYGDSGDRDPAEKYAEGVVGQSRFSPRKGRGAPMRARDYADERGRRQEHYADAQREQ